jgi:hypothetical protein
MGQRMGDDGVMRLRSVFAAVEIPSAPNDVFHRNLDPFS